MLCLVLQSIAFMSMESHVLLRPPQGHHSMPHPLAGDVTLQLRASSRGPFALNRVYRSLLGTLFGAAIVFAGFAGGATWSKGARSVSPHLLQRWAFTPSVAGVHCPGLCRRVHSAGAVGLSTWGGGDRAPQNCGGVWEKGSIDRTIHQFL